MVNFCSVQPQTLCLPFIEAVIYRSSLGLPIEAFSRPTMTMMILIVMMVMVMVMIVEQVMMMPDGDDEVGDDDGEDDYQVGKRTDECQLAVSLSSISHIHHNHFFGGIHHNQKHNHYNQR